MRIMLSSFGLGHEYLSEIPDVPPVFARLPPLNMRSAIRPFEPEYSLLILCDKLILDELSFERLRENSSPIFATMARTVKLLHEEGFVELADYSSVLSNNIDLLRKMTDSDVTSADQWRHALHTSEAVWQDYVIRSLSSQISLAFRIGEIGDVREFLHVTPHYPPRSQLYQRGFEPSHTHSPEHPARSRMQKLLNAYLIYINANLILSNEMDSALHDWEDFLPFYHQKFLSVGRRHPPAVAEADASRKLFDIVLPELAVDSPEHLLRILNHRHIRELRALIDSASQGSVEFDAEFARNVFREVFGIERKAAKGRRIIGYVTLPIGFIPLIGNFAQAIVQEAAGTLLEKRLRKPYRWLYMLSDLAQQPPA